MQSFTLVAASSSAPFRGVSLNEQADAKFGRPEMGLLRDLPEVREFLEECADNPEIRVLVVEGEQASAHYRTLTVELHIPVVDVDDLLLEMGHDPARQGTIRHLPPEGVFRRLLATLESMQMRGLANSTLHISEYVDGPNPSRFPGDIPKEYARYFSWHSERSMFVREGGICRRWAATGRLVVSTDLDLNVRGEVADGSLVALGKTGGATRFVGEAVNGALAERVLRVLGRRHLLEEVAGKSIPILSSPIQLEEDWSSLKWVLNQSWR